MLVRECQMISHPSRTQQNSVEFPRAREFNLNKYDYKKTMGDVPWPTYHGGTINVVCCYSQSSMDFEDKY